jgi:hypothetical protein
MNVIRPLPRTRQSHGVVADAPPALAVSVNFLGDVG